MCERAYIIQIQTAKLCTHFVFFKILSNHLFWSKRLDTRSQYFIIKMDQFTFLKLCIAACRYIGPLISHFLFLKNPAEQNATISFLAR